MAEIHVQAKKHHNSSPVWIWIAALVLIAAAVIYYLSTRNNNAGQNNTQNQTNTTSAVELPQQFTGAAHVFCTVV